MQTIHRDLLTDGIYNCPLYLDGYIICHIENKFNLIASETRVKNPEINAREAIIVSKLKLLCYKSKSYV